MLKIIYKPIEKILLNKHYSYRNSIQDVTLITNNCLGGYLYDRLGKKFISPTINLQFPRFTDYIKFCNNLDYYLKRAEFTKVDNLPIDIIEYFHGYDVEPNFPFGKLDDIYICFQHYSSYEDGVKKWNERKNRINWEKISLIAVIENNQPLEIIDEFYKLPYRKVLISTRKVNDNRVYNLGLSKGEMWFSKYHIFYQCFDKVDYREIFK